MIWFICLLFAAALFFIVWHTVRLYHLISDMFYDISSCIIRDDDNDND